MNRRSETVRKAINRYNEQAALLDAPVIDWQEIAGYAFIGEFETLRLARSDIRREKWVQKAHRDAGIRYFKLCRAREEIQRLNVEVRRLLTWIQDEKKHTEQIIERLSVNEPLLADELRKRWTLRSSVNAAHLQRLKILQQEDYYTGPRDCGEATGALQRTYSDGITANDQITAEIQQDEDFESIADFMANIDD